jgi:hypothetical protein
MKRIPATAWCAVALLALVVLLVLVVPAGRQDVDPWDESLRKLIVPIGPSGLDGLAVAASALGSMGVILPLGMAMTGLLLVYRKWPGLVLSGWVLAGYPLTYLLKYVFHRPSPGVAAIRPLPGNALGYYMDGIIRSQVAALPDQLNLAGTTVSPRALTEIMAYGFPSAHACTGRVRFCSGDGSTRRCSTPAAGGWACDGWQARRLPC